MKNLLLTTIGKSNHLDAWLNGKSNFEVILIKYEQFDQKELQHVETHEMLGGFKYPSIGEFISNNPKILEFDFIFMPDEDVLLSGKEINAFFDWAKKINPDLSQPSIRPKNHTFGCTVNNDSSCWREVTNIEIMCPMFNKRALTQLYPTFDESYSGWGLEPVWSKLLSNPLIAVCDLVIAEHTRKLNLNSGRLYEKLKALTGMTPHEEMRKVLNKFSANHEWKTIKEHV